MKPALDEVVELIRAGVDVEVVTGQYDLIVDTLCVYNWLELLPSDISAALAAAPRSEWRENTEPSTSVSGYAQKWYYSASLTIHRRHGIGSRG